MPSKCVSATGRKFLAVKLKRIQKGVFQLATFDSVARRVTDDIFNLVVLERIYVVFVGGGSMTSTERS